MIEIIISVYVASIVLAFFCMKCDRKENDIDGTWEVVILTILMSIVSPAGIIIGFGALLRRLKIPNHPKWI